MPNPAAPWETNAPAADSGNGILVKLGGSTIAGACPVAPTSLERPKAGERRVVDAQDPQRGWVRITYELKKNPRFATWFWTAVWAEDA